MTTTITSAFHASCESDVGGPVWDMFLQNSFHDGNYSPSLAPLVDTFFLFFCFRCCSVISWFKNFGIWACKLVSADVWKQSNWSLITRDIGFIGIPHHWWEKTMQLGAVVYYTTLFIWRCFMAARRVIPGGIIECLNCADFFHPPLCPTCPFSAGICVQNNSFLCAHVKMCKVLNAQPDLRRNSQKNDFVGFRSTEVIRKAAKLIFSQSLPFRTSWLERILTN